MSSGMAPLFLEHIRSSARRSSVTFAVRPLTEREKVVLGHMARGLSYAETGQVLGVSLNTIRTYVRGIYEKLDVESRTEAVLLGIKLGLIKGTPYPGPLR
jgi:DNA-binding CsgD family transcriptional regulator